MKSLIEAWVELVWRIYGNDKMIPSGRTIIAKDMNGCTKYHERNYGDDVIEEKSWRKMGAPWSRNI